MECSLKGSFILKLELIEIKFKKISITPSKIIQLEVEIRI